MHIYRYFVLTLAIACLITTTACSRRTDVSIPTEKRIDHAAWTGELYLKGLEQRPEKLAKTGRTIDYMWTYRQQRLEKTDQGLKKWADYEF